MQWRIKWMHQSYRRRLVWECKSGVNESRTKWNSSARRQICTELSQNQRYVSCLNWKSVYKCIRQLARLASVLEYSIIRPNYIAAVKQVLYQGSTKVGPIPRIFPISHSCKLATGMHKPKVHHELLVQHKVARGAANLATLEMTLAQCSYPGEPNY